MGKGNGRNRWGIGVKKNTWVLGKIGLVGGKVMHC